MLLHAMWVTALVALVAATTACSVEPTPTVRPTPTPTPAPTPTPTPPPTPTPAPTPTLPFGGVWEGLPDIESLEWDRADLAAVTALPWIADGIDTQEREAAREVALLAAHYGDVFRLLKPKAWLNDGLHQAERDVLFALLEVAEADDGVAQHIAAMPFWGTLEPQSDVATLKDIAELAQKKPGLFDHLSGQTWVTDGLTPTERLFVELSGQFTSEVARSTAIAEFAALLEHMRVQDGLNLIETALIERVVDFHSVEAVEAAFTLIRAVLGDGWVQRAQWGPAVGHADSQLIERLMWVRGGVANTGPILLLQRPWIADGLSDAEYFVLTHRGWGPGDSMALDAIENLLDESWAADGLDEVERLLLRRKEAIPSAGEVSAVASVLAEPWVLDGLDATERSLISSVWGRTLGDDKAFALIADLLDAPWVQDGVSEVEQALILSLGPFENDDSAETLSHAVNVLSRETWVADGLDEAERNTLSLLNASAFEGMSAESIRALGSLSSLPWIQDGLDIYERAAVSDERVIAVLAASFDEPWVQDGVSSAERRLIESLGPFENDDSASVSASVNALLRQPWAADTLDEDERFIVGLLGAYSLKGTTAEGVQAIETLLGQPWIQDGLSEDERFALSALGARLADAHIIRYVGQLLKRPWAQDGLDDIERRVVQHIFRYGLEVPPLGVQREEKVAELPHTGTVRFTLVWVSGGPRRDVDWLERNTRAVEELMGLPLPTNHVSLFLSPGPAAHFGAYIGVPAGVGSDWYEGAILHELGHYYWGSNLGWVNEGMAAIIEDIIDEPRDGKPVDADNHPCARVRTIAELEQVDFYSCTYTLGKRIFLDLYRTVGHDAFRASVQGLYSVLQEHHIDIDDLRASFKKASPGHAEAIDTIIARWYDGTEPFVEPVLDAPPSNSALPDVGLYIEGLDIAPVRGNPPVAVLPAKSVRERGPWLRLRLQVTHRLPGSQSQLQVVGYYEDGFVFWRRDVAIPRDPQSHTVWMPFGPDPDYGVAPGRYWIEVSYQGQKLAETAFRVT